MKKEKLTKILRMRLTLQEKNQLKKISIKLGFKSLSSFIRFILRSESERILNDPALFKAYVHEAREGVLLVHP